MSRPEEKRNRYSEDELSLDFILPFYSFARGLVVGLPLAIVAVILVIVFTGNKTVAIALGCGISFVTAVIFMRFRK